MKLSRKTCLALAALLALALCARLEDARRKRRHTRAFFAMDTPVALTAYGPAAPRALERAERLVRRLEREMSVTVADSGVSRLNAGEEIPADGTVGRALSAALEMREKTGGAFDPALYPALRLWGFTTGKYAVPAQAEIDAALRLSGAARVRKTESGFRLNSGAAVDLGGIGKGWASDAAADCLRENGVESAVVSLGGNVRTLGPRPGGAKWRVGVRDPEGGLLGVIAIGEGAVVTSGNYERFFEKDGERYWHILDPRTGKPARSGVVSATVIGKRGAACDALSTALFVMGPEKSADWLRKNPGYGAVILDENGALYFTENLGADFVPDERRRAAARVLGP